MLMNLMKRQLLGQGAASTIIMMPIAFTKGLILGSKWFMIMCLSLHQVQLLQIKFKQMALLVEPLFKLKMMLHLLPLLPHLPLLRPQLLRHQHLLLVHRFLAPLTKLELELKQMVAITPLQHQTLLKHGVEFMSAILQLTPHTLSIKIQHLALSTKKTLWTVHSLLLFKLTGLKLEDQTQTLLKIR